MEGDAIEAVRRWETKRRHRVRRHGPGPEGRPGQRGRRPGGVELRLRLADPPLEGARRHPAARDALGRPSLEEATRLLGYRTPWRPRWSPTRRRSASGRWRCGPASPIKGGAALPARPDGPRGLDRGDAALREFIAAQIERLEGLREEAWEAVDGPEAEAVAAKALMDAGKEAQVRHRYYRDAQMAQQRAAKLLMTLRDRKRAGIVDASQGVTGAAVLEALCVEVVARDRAEAAASAASSPNAATATPRTEANATADRGEADRHNPNEKSRLENAPATRPEAATKRTEPRFPHVDDPKKGSEWARRRRRRRGIRRTGRHDGSVGEQGTGAEGGRKAGPRGGSRHSRNGEWSLAGQALREAIADPTARAVDAGGRRTHNDGPADGPRRACRGRDSPTTARARGRCDWPSARTPISASPSRRRPAGSPRSATRGSS